MKYILFLTWLSAFLQLAEAQISIVDAGVGGNQVSVGGAYTQSFDSLANANTASVPWLNNGTLPGWYAYRQSSGDIVAYNPSQSTSPFGSFGIIGEADRSLGSSLNGGLADAIHFGVQFVNNSSSLINSFDISFDGEQWFYGTRSGEMVESLVFSYQIFDAGEGSLSEPTGWTEVDELLFASPINGGEPVRQALNGNFSANRRDGIADSITGLTLASGQELWIRWTAINNLLITDDALSIDNLRVRFTAIPEPSTYATVAGCLIFLTGLRRRRH